MGGLWKVENSIAPASQKKRKRREPDSGDFCTLNVAYVVMHTDCAATPRQRQTIEHFRHAGRYKFGTLLEYPVEIFRRNRTLIFSTTISLSGLRVRSSATASLNCLTLTSSFPCLRSPFPVSLCPFLSLLPVYATFPI